MIIFIAILLIGLCFLVCSFKEFRIMQDLEKTGTSSEAEAVDFSAQRATRRRGKKNTFLYKAIFKYETSKGKFKTFESKYSSNVFLFGVGHKVPILIDDNGKPTVATFMGLYGLSSGLLIVAVIMFILGSYGLIEALSSKVFLP